MRTVYLGTSDFAAAVLRRLAGSPHRPSLVVTRPDRPRGRGRQLSAPPVAEAARALELPLIQPEALGAPETLEQIDAAAPQAVCVCAYGVIIREPLLSRYPMVNVHPSLLPRWRGAAPIERAIMAGDADTGVSIMRLTEGLDSGPVCLQERIAIEPDDTYGSLASRLERLGGDLLVEALASAPPYNAQDDGAVTYAEKITAADRRLDPARPAVELERVVRALTPHIGAYVELAGGEPLGIAHAHAAGPGAAGPGAAAHSGDTAGTVRAGEDGVPELVCAQGSLRLLAVKPAGRREMAGADWLRGRR